MKIRSWRVWSWNWRKRKTVAQCKTIEEMVSVVLNGHKTKRPPYIFKFSVLNIWLMLYAIPATCLIYPVMFVEDKWGKNAISEILEIVAALGMAATTILSVVLIKLSVSGVMPWWVMPSFFFVNAITYLWADYGGHISESNKQNITDIQEVARNHVDEAKKSMIGDESLIKSDLNKTNARIAVLVNERAVWVERQVAGHFSAVKALEIIDDDMATQKSHKHALERRIELHERLFAAAHARIDAQTPLIEERKHLEELRASISSTKEMQARLDAVDADLKKKLVEEMGLVFQTLNALEHYIHQIPEHLSGEEIKQRVHMTAPADIAFEQAFEDLHSNLLVESSEEVEH